eukprot:scaffold89576_cov16-Prasinocladus_malaysianus.AAC.2
MHASISLDMMVNRLAEALARKRPWGDRLPARDSSTKVQRTKTGELLSDLDRKGVDICCHRPS